MALYRYTLDATVLSVDPIGWDKFKAGWARSLDTRSVMSFKPSGDLVFVEDGFDYLSNQYSTSGNCGQVALKVERKEYQGGTFATVYDGTIHLIDIEWDLDKNFAKVAFVRDADYMTLLNDNADIKAQIDLDRSKNDEAITGAATIDIDFHNTTLGTWGYTNRPSYQVYDVLEYLVAYCSDGNLQFDSTFFGAGGDGEGIFLMYGSVIRTGTGTPLTLSWSEIRLELYKKYNVVPIVDETTTPTTIRMEQAEDTYEQTVSTSYTIGEISGLKRRGIPFSVKPEVFNGDKPLGSFTNIKLGTGDTLDTGDYPDIRFKCWDAEEYHILSECAAKQTFDLEGEWLCDSNIIEDITKNGTTTWDSNIFIVETEYPTNARTKQFDLIVPGSGPYTYNDGLTNASVVLRFLGAIPNSIAAFIGDGADEFQAEKTVTSSSAGGSLDLNPCDFDDDSTAPNHDTNGNYDAVTNYRYTIPSNGAYTFRVVVEYLNVVVDPTFYPSFDSTITVRRYNSGGTLLESDVDIATVSADGDHTFNTKIFYADSTDYFDVRVQGATNGAGPGVASWDVPEAFFLTTAIENSGGVWQTIDPSTYRGSFYQFQVPMTFSEYLAIVTYPTIFDAVFINRGGFPNDITGWLIAIELDLGNNLATLEIISAD